MSIKLINRNVISAASGRTAAVVSAALMLPTDRVRPPTEYDLFLNGETEAPALPTPGAAGEVAQQDFGGSYGYVMED